jgi:hypothetical protein
MLARGVLRLSQTSKSSLNRYKAREWIVPVLLWTWSTLIVLVAVNFSMSVVELCARHPDYQSRVDIPSAMAAWDGRWQVDIIRHGYQKKINWQDLNPAAFPPLYPILGGLLYKLGLREEVALLIVSNAAFLAYLVVFYYYCRDRGSNERRATLATALVSISPFSHFFHMAYTESLFCLLAGAFLLGIHRRWHPMLLAILVAAAGATRVVGITLVPILFVFTFLYYRESILRWFISPVAALTGASGFFAFMLHLSFMQGDMLAMFTAQAGWTQRPEFSFVVRIVHAISGQPLVDAYRSDCICYWENSPPQDLPFFNMQFWNPIVLLSAGFLIGLGWFYRRLNWYELFYCFLVLGVPYFTQGYRICLHSQSRYALAAFPLAMVVAWGLLRLESVARWMLLTVSAVLLFGNTAMFIGWYFNY